MSARPSPECGRERIFRSDAQAGVIAGVVTRAAEPLRLGSVWRMPIAVSSFVLDSFDEEPPFVEDPGVQYARIRIAKTFRGDIEAQSTVEMLSVRAENGGAGYVAVERIAGSVHGRSGSFAVLHVGTMAGESQWARWPVVPGSGTGDLARISGEGRIEIAHDGAHQLHLDYEFC